MSSWRRSLASLGVVVTLLIAGCASEERRPGESASGPGQALVVKTSAAEGNAVIAKDAKASTAAPAVADPELVAARARLERQEPGQALDLALSVAAASEADRPLRSARALAIAGEALLALERADDAAQAFDRACEHAARAAAKGEAGAADTRARALANLAIARLRRDDAQGALGALDRIAEPGAPQAGPSARAAGLRVRAIVHAEKGEDAQARASLAEARRLAESAGDAALVARCDALREDMDKARAGRGEDR